MTDISKLPRTRGWEQRLAKVLTDEAARAFVWGETDCLCLVGTVAKAMTGVDPVAPWRGQYQTEFGAGRAMIEAGFGDLASALSAHFEEIGPALARRGDCGLVETGVPGAPCAAVIVLGAELMGKSSAGTTIIARNRLVRAYRIGD